MAARGISFHSHVVFYRQTFFYRFISLRSSGKRGRNKVFFSLLFANFNHISDFHDKIFKKNRLIVFWIMEEKEMKFEDQKRKVSKFHPLIIHAISIE
jgi:hypothetical protein